METWNSLKYHDQNVYKVRAKIVDNRTELKLNQFGVQIHPNIADGNCLIYAILKYLGIDSNTENVLEHREKLVNYMELKNYSILLEPNETLNQFKKNYEYLDEIHVNAAHNLYTVNIVIFSYDIEKDGITQLYYHNKNFSETLFLIYKSHAKHYDSGTVNEVYTLPSKDGFYKVIDGSKYKALQTFDEKYNVCNLLAIGNGNGKQSQTFMSEIIYDIVGLSYYSYSYLVFEISFCAPTELINITGNNQFCKSRMDNMDDIEQIEYFVSLYETIDVEMN
eukprot:525001_1